MGPERLLDPWLDGVFEHAVQGRYGSRLHYVIGGQGDPVLLVAGWPQTWYAWRKVMPALARHYMVVAVDLPGLGDSDKPAHGYDTRAVATRLHELVVELGLQPLHFVGHDIGCWVGYPYASMYPLQLEKLVLIDATVPGLTPNEAYAFESARIHKNWHFYFNALPDLPEALVAGREREWLAWLFEHKAANPAAIEAVAKNEYARCYSAPGGLRAGFTYYRALFESMKQNREFSRERLKTPVLTIGGDAGVGSLLGAIMRELAYHVEEEVVPDCGHYVPEEAPEFLAERLRSFFTTERPA